MTPGHPVRRTVRLADGLGLTFRVQASFGVGREQSFAARAGDGPAFVRVRYDVSFHLPSIWQVFSSRLRSRPAL